MDLVSYMVLSLSCTYFIDIFIHSNIMIRSTQIYIFVLSYSLGIGTECKVTYFFDQKEIHLSGQPQLEEYAKYQWNSISIEYVS